MVRAQGLSKLYHIGAVKAGPRTLVGAVTNAARSTVRRALQNGSRGEVELWALKGVTFELNRGEVMGIIGRNGSGKSTLLKLLSRVTAPTEGLVELYGHVGTLLEVGTGFHPELTGRENVYLNGTILGMKKNEIDRVFDEIVEFSELAKFIDTPVKHYSSGMYVRLGFAVAAHLKPEILLVDEVLAVGDAAFQKKCLGRIGDMAKEGRTVLFVSHNMLAIENLCARTIWIDDGTIRQDGRTRHVIHDYLSSSVKQNAGLDVSNAIRDRGTGEIKFVRVEFLDERKKTMDVIRSGDRVTWRLHFCADAPIAHPHFIISIETELGIVVTQLATFLMGYQLPIVETGAGHVDLDISFLNLMPGRYNLSLAIWDEIKGYYDYIRNCVALDIQPSDFYQSGKGIEERYGIIFLPGKWKYAGG